MAGFMSGLGSSLSSGIDAAVKAKQEQEADSFRLSFQTYLSRKDKLTALQDSQAKTARRAKEYAAMYGQTPDTARQIYDWLDSGMSEAAVTERLEKFKLTPVEAVPALAKIDTQMADSGLDPRASTAPETDPQNRMVQRSIGRIAEITGESPDAISNVMSGRSTPPEIGTGQVGSFKLVPKDVAPDKLTDADVVAKLTKLQTDVANGVEGAQTRLEVFEKVTLPAYRNSKQALESPTGDNVLPDLIYRYGQAQEGSPERSQLAGRIEAFRRAAELRKGDTSDGYSSSVIFNEDGTTDIGMVRTVIGENGERSYVRLEKGKPVRVEGEVQKLDDEQRRQLQAVYAERGGEIAKHEDAMVRTADALRLSQQVFDLVESDPRVLTVTAGVAKSATGLAREILTASDVLKEMAERNGSISTAEIEKALGGSLGSVSDRIDQALGSDVADLGQKRALLDAKTLLAGFRLGGLEGQSGNGLSNADYERILQIVRSSADPATFRRSWADYIQGRIQAVDMKAELASSYNSRLDAFEASYGYRPADPIQPSLTDYIEKSGQMDLQRAYRTITDLANAPLAKPAQNAPQTITRDGKTLRLIEVLPDGRARYEDPETGRTGTMPVAGNGETPSDGRRAVAKLADGRTVYELPDGRKVVRKRVDGSQ